TRGREPHPAAALADHLHAFWTPAMLRQIFAHLAAHGEDGLDPIARTALAELAAGHAPPPQTKATDPAHHGADAG
ncbi:formate dehydrogenase subunit delta, partial [Novosphingobium sp. B-7]|uniref:formate dehydrogenase subunit delta n=1 Tax=Novosphingobium sp. B-7 TaxID=1298855 RepID=UPI0011D29558